MRGQETFLAMLQQSIDNGELAGAAVLAYQAGRMQSACAGWCDIESNLPMRHDAIFRIASMTKPVTSVAALMLVEEGRIQLNDPIASIAPEFASMRVLRSPNGPLDDTVSATRPITFEDLLTHRAGFTYADFHRGPIAAAYREGLGGDIDSHVAPGDWIANLARLPLIGQPGSAMYYGCSTDLLGLLMAKIEGAPLGVVLEQRIFGPLGMRDTTFCVPRQKWSRRAAAYGFDEQGRLIKRPTLSGIAVEERPQNMAYESGGAGLWSTLDDYLKFARLFLGDGQVDGVRLLRPETLRQMMSNQLTADQRANSTLLGRKPFAVGRGFGFGLSVVLLPDHSDMARRGSTGTVSWPGAFGGWWQADPVQQSIFIFLAHNMVDLSQMARGVGLGVWALVERLQTAALGVS